MYTALNMNNLNTTQKKYQMLRLLHCTVTTKLKLILHTSSPKNSSALFPSFHMDKFHGCSRRTRSFMVFIISGVCAGHLQMTCEAALIKMYA